MKQTTEHKYEEDQPVEADEGLGQALVVARRTAEARASGKGTLQHPARRQEHKAALGFLQFHHDQADGLGRHLGWLLPGVTLIGTGDLSIFARCLLGSYFNCPDYCQEKCTT